jgi:hypothetical protein
MGGFETTRYTLDFKALTERWNEEHSDAWQEITMGVVAKIYVNAEKETLHMYQ